MFGFNTHKRLNTILWVGALVSLPCFTLPLHAEQWGIEIPVSLPIDDLSERQVSSALRSITPSKESETRPIVVLEFGAAQSGGNVRETKFERALGLSRLIMGSTSIRTIAYLNGPVEGHAVLAVLACDQIITTSSASLGAAGVIEDNIDPVIEDFYRSVCKRRRTIPEDVASAMLDRSNELVQIKSVDGTSLFLSGQALSDARDQGNVVDELQLSTPGQFASFSGAELRRFRWASHEVQNKQEMTDLLGLAGLKSSQAQDQYAPHGVVAPIHGPINAKRIGRLINSLNDSVNRRGCNLIISHLRSSGGNIDQSMRLAGAIAANKSDGIRTVSFIEEARGDAALIALVAGKTYMSPDGILGGPGEATFTKESFLDLKEAFDEVAAAAGVSPALLFGMLDPDTEIYQYTDTRTGRVAYFRSQDLAGRDDIQRWKQGERIYLSGGLNAEQAVQLGLVDKIVPDLKSASEESGLESIPGSVEDRPIIEFVEQLGQQAWFARMLLFIGFFMLMVETGAPGLGIPGFLSLLCLILFFWTQAVGGTAEWLEILLFAGGIACLILEVFVIPGFGIFGIGGAIMVVTSLVLVSQTFVVPSNSYQYQQMTSSLLSVISAFVGLAGGVVALRWIAPQIPFMRHLVMEQDEEQLQAQRAAESLVDWNHLVGSIGVTTTPLVPSGKARFADDLVVVLSSGALIESGKPVIVKEVHGNRVIVEERDVATGIST